MVRRVREEKESEKKKAEKRKSQRRKKEKRQSQKKEQSPRKGRKVAKHCIFPMVRGSGGSTSRLAKVAGVEPSSGMKDRKLHPVVARRRFGSQNAKNTSCPQQFWQLSS